MIPESAGGVVASSTLESPGDVPVSLGKLPPRRLPVQPRATTERAKTVRMVMESER